LSVMTPIELFEIHFFFSSSMLLVRTMIAILAGVICFLQGHPLGQLGLNGPDKELQRKCRAIVLILKGLIGGLRGPAIAWQASTKRGQPRNDRERANLK
jgi:hypothetical protein